MKKQTKKKNKTIVVKKDKPKKILYLENENDISHFRFQNGRLRFFHEEFL